MPAALAMTLSPLAGAGSGIVVVWRAPHHQAAEGGESDRLRQRVEVLELARAEAESRIADLARQIKDAYELSRVCCAPKKRP